MTKSTLKRLVIGHATASKRQLLDKGFITNRTVWDKVFLRQFQSLLGGRVHTWVSGSGVINAAVRGLIREVFGCMILECYGLTECCGCASATNFANYQREDECVGPPQPWNEIKGDSEYVDPSTPHHPTNAHSHARALIGTAD